MSQYSWFTVYVSTQNIDLSKYLGSQGKNGNKEKKKVEKQLLKPHILSEDIADRLTKFVEKRNLLEVGHFKLHTNSCARDWIVADEVIETSPIFKKCEAQFLLHLAEKMKGMKEYLVVGIDFCGMLIASKLAYVMGKPYTYVIPDSISSSHREAEFVLLRRIVTRQINPRNSTQSFFCIRMGKKSRTIHLTNCL